MSFTLPFSFPSPSLPSSSLPFSTLSPLLRSTFPHHRRSSPRSLAADRLRPPESQSPIAMSPPESSRELAGESDFETILSPDARISVCGFGSLLSERSARSTFPGLENFRVARLSGFRRVFAHAAPIFFERGIAKPETKEISSLSVEPCTGESLIVTVFEIQKQDIPAFLERELEFRFLAVLCARYSDEEFFQIRCKGSKDVFYKLYGRYNIDKIWRDDIFPCRTYLRHCVLAAKNLSELAYNNFLDHTFLGDRKTTIREYLAAAGLGIMEEEPPDSLKTRYGG